MDSVARVGEPAPRFTLHDLTGEAHSPVGQEGIHVLNFWSAECPWSERSDPAILHALQEASDGVRYWPIASNADEGPDSLSPAARQRGLPVLLLDSEQRVADLYGAKTTPHIFVIDSQGILRYAGAPDDSSFRQREASRWYLREVLSALRAGRLPPISETPGRGCALVRFPAG